MIQIACPHCQSILEDDGSLAGQQVQCPRCARYFTMPLGRSPSPKSAPAIVQTPTIRTTHQRLQSVDVFRIAYLLDWKFKHYLTPWIIRGYWIISLVSASLAAIALSVHLLASLMDELPKSTPSAGGVSIEHRVDNPFSNFSQPSSKASQTIDRVLWKFAGWIGGMALLLSGLLAIRLACESVIVLFNIAASATAIEKSLRNKVS